MYNDKVLNILATSFIQLANIHYSYQHYQPGKVTDVSADDLIFSSYVTWITYDLIDAIFCGFKDYCSENRYREKKAYVCGKRSHIKGRLLILSW